MREASKVLSLACVLGAVTALTVGTGSAAAGTMEIPMAGTGSPQTGAFTPSGNVGPEFLTAESESAPDAYSGNIIDRSLSNGAGNGVGVASGRKAKSNPTVDTSFQGLNHYQQRYARGGNQFSVEPPDQGLCVGNGYEVEAVNDVLNIFNASGQSVLPDNTATNIVSGFPRDVNHAVDLNSFYGYPAAINRSLASGSPGRFGPVLTDPSCLYDAQTQRFFVVVLTLEVNSTSGG